MNQPKSYLEDRTQPRTEEDIPLAEQSFAREVQTLARSISPRANFVGKLETRLEAAALPLNGRGQAENVAYATHSRRVKAWGFSAILLAVLVLLLGSVLAFPALRSAAQTALRYFAPGSNPVSPNFIPPVGIAQPTDMVPTPTATVGDQATNSGDKFTIGYPFLLPQNWKIYSLNYYKQKGTVTIVFSYYGRSAIGTLELVERPADEMAGTVIAPPDRVEQVQIGDVTAEYARGIWYRGHATFQEVKSADLGDKDLIWVDNDNYRILRWQKDGVMYKLYATGARMYMDYLGKDDLANIAINIQPIPPEKPYPTPIPFQASGTGDENATYQPITDLETLKTLAGFDIWLPEKMLPNYEFAYGNRYLDGNGLAYNQISLTYKCTDDSSWQFILNEQELVNINTNYAGDPNAFYFENTPEPIILGDVEGEYLKGYWVSNTDGHFAFSPSNGTWDASLNSFQLGWKKDGYKFWLFSSGGDFQANNSPCLPTKEDLITFAEGLQPMGK